MVMTESLWDKRIKNALLEVLREQQEQDEKNSSDQPKQKKSSSKMTGIISTTGAFGTGGRAKSFVMSAKARAEDDPKGLMGDLGVTSPSSGSDIEAALDILRTAIYSNEVMGEAYNGAKVTQDVVVTDQEGRNLEVIAVSLGGLDRKNGIRFLAHTLTAAKNAGYLNLSGGLQFATGLNNPIIIYSI